MLYSVKHTTTYTYSDFVPLCINLATLAPRNTDAQICRSIRYEISPNPEVFDEYDDFFGNRTCFFVVEQEHKRLSVTTHSVIETQSPQWKLKSISLQTWESAIADLKNSDTDIRQYSFSTEITEPLPEIKNYTLQSFSPGRPLYEAAFELMQRIYKDFKYTTGFTTISTPLSVVMREKKGVCQDFAHLAIACLQTIGLAARYVSGYLETIPPPGRPKLVGSDASHAWFSLYIPQMGWIDFDPTNNKHPDEQYLTIGWGRNYFDIVPLRGIIQTSHQHQLDVKVDVSRLE